MDHKYNCHKGDWIASFRCRFTENGERKWECCRIQNPANAIDEWTAKGNDHLGEIRDERISLLDRATFIKKLPGFADFIARDEFVVDQQPLYESPEHVFAFVPKTPTGNTEVTDIGTSILLNHIITAQSMEPLVTVASVLGNRRMIEVRGLRAGQPSWFFLRMLVKRRE